MPTPNVGIFLFLKLCQFNQDGTILEYKTLLIRNIIKSKVDIRNGALITQETFDETIENIFKRYNFISTNIAKAISRLNKLQNILLYKSY